MPKARWFDPTPREREMVEEAAPSGGSFPDFTGSGSPEGVVTAEPGKTYRDTANGSLYVKASSSDNTGWAGLALLNFADTADGITFGASQIFLLANEVLLSDVGAWNGTGNGVDYRGTSGDGSQRLFIQLGDTGQFVTRFNADGTTEFPGAIKGPIVALLAKGNGMTYLSNEAADSGTGNGIYFQGNGADGAQTVVIELGSTDQFETKFGADGTTQFPGDVTLPAGKGPIVHDSADGHTYRLGTTNGVVTATQVT